MDKLAKRLRDDAEQIEVAISPELDDRIRATLTGAGQDGRAALARPDRPASFWWASSLTGVAATIAVIVIVNLSSRQADVAITEPPLQAFEVPRFDWNPQTAMLSETLQQEFEDIQSDLKRAEQLLREDLDDVL